MDLRISTKYLAFIFSLGLFAAWPVAVFGQILSQVRSEVRANSTPTKPPESNDSHRDDRDDDDDEDDNLVGNFISAFLFGSNNRSNRRAQFQSEPDDDIDYEIYSSQEQVESFAFLEFPYADGQWGGLIQTNRTESESTAGQAFGKPGRLTLATWYGTDFDNIDSWNAHLRMENQGLIGLDFQWSHLTEKLSGLPRDSLNLADVNLTYRWIESPGMISRIGGGINLLTDRFGTEVDYNFTLSTDFFPAKPWILCFELDHGELASSHQTHLLSTLGVNYRRFEYLIGYEYRKLGSIEINGPLMGFKYWW